MIDSNENTTNISKLLKENMNEIEDNMTDKFNWIIIWIK